ncbi:hypothetical protein [Halovenus salina]|uniref:Uncharacterized protein n=1 Tax=Halovenus salina TaxID=1510225 RepID=A0ABD5VZU4_9EURY|nr:hypothetical protein [Halovenus salina]
MTVPDADRIAEYLQLNADAATPEVLGATDTEPTVWGDVVGDALASNEPHLALETPDTSAPEKDFGDGDPILEADKPASTTSEAPDTDGSALVDALEWFHQQLDRDLPDECNHDTPRDEVAVYLVGGLSVRIA